ncbi:MAG: polyprenyl diphosphate synthase [Candidatus Babeliales bacterium]|jgi:undecaprenyl diphosphate synthase
MQHLAIIPDGNRRWAAQHKLESFFGHKKGLEPVQSAIKVCIEKSIRHLSFYTFSLENFKRSDHEKSYLFNLLADNFISKLPDLIKNGVRIRFIGDRSRFPEKIRAIVHQTEQETEHLSTLNVNLLFCYGATAELTQAVRAIAQQVKDGIITPEQITEETLRSSLWTVGIPDPDLIIRTGGLARLSNFLLFQSAYSEFSFLDCYWPDVTEEKLKTCIDQFNQTKRNFGQ